MGLETLVYSPLFEDCTPDLTGWCKETVDYITKNRQKVYSTIRGIAKNSSKSRLQNADVEDIYSEVVMYCYQYDDYNINKAIERSSNGNIVSLEGYIHSCIKYCVLRYITKMYESEKDILRDNITSDDGNELSLLDIVEDKNSANPYEDIMYDLDCLCKSCESIRYKYGPDLYLIWYVRLLTIANDKSNVVFKDILNILGIFKKDVLMIEEKSLNDELMLSFAKSISLAGIDKSINIIESYIYCPERIKEAISMYI